jgi:methylmalonyl-CoA mutase cobalamin-binding subunit
MRTLAGIVEEAKRVLPPWEEVAAEAQERAGKIKVGQSLFCQQQGVASEAEYKRRAKARGQIMLHTHIGLDTWQETKSALLYLYDEMSKRGLVLDRFGLCLDRVMAYPPPMRHLVPRETGPQLASLEDWIEVGQVVPIQPHAGDFMIGFPASVVNTENALRAGITTIGNLSQYFAHGVPNWSDEVKTASETAKAIAIMGRLKPKGTLVHSYLDDGFGALFTDYADVVGWAYLEQYIVESLCGAKLAHCFGGLTVDPMTRVAWVFIMREIHGEDCLGSMWYGDTISFSDDFDRNLGLNAEYLLWDIIAQLVCPTGHAVLPLPVTEAVRIPTAKDILQAQVMARRVEESARRMVPYVDLSQAQAIKDRLIGPGRAVFVHALAGLKAGGVDVQNPLQMLFVLKKMGPVQFQREFGAGTLDPAWPRGRKPVQLTDMFAKTYAASEAMLKDLPKPAQPRELKVALGATDVHEHALFIIERALQAMGFSPLMLGPELNPADIVRRAQQNGADVIVVSTYNGMALEVGKALRGELDRLGLRIPVFMGGRLNQGVEGQALPVDVTADLAALGLTPCQTIPELLQKLGQSPRMSPSVAFS